MSKVRDLLIARRQEIKAEFGPLQTELNQIDAALAAIEAEAPARRERKHPAAKGKSRKSETPKEKPKRQRTRQLSIADQSVSVLKQNPEGLDTAEMARKLDEAYGRKTTTRTVSTQLSTMKREGRIIQEGKVWRLPTIQPEAPREDAEFAS